MSADKSLSYSQISNASTHSMTLRSSSRQSCAVEYKSAKISPDNSFEAYFTSDRQLKNNTVCYSSLPRKSSLLLKKANFSSELSAEYCKTSLEDSCKLSLKQPQVSCINGIPHSLVTETHSCLREIINEVCTSTTTHSSYSKEKLNAYNIGLILASRHKSSQSSMGKKQDRKSYARCSNGESMYSDEEADIPFSSISSPTDTSLHRRDAVLQQLSEQKDYSLVSENNFENSMTVESSNNRTKVLNPSPINWSVRGEKIYDECDSDDYDNSMFGQREIGQTGGYLMLWRKWLYFILSKPTHYDVENLSRINTFGKKKTIFLLLLPLFLYLLTGAFINRKAWEFHPVQSPVFYSLETPVASVLTYHYGISSLWSSITNLIPSLISSERSSEVLHSEDMLVSKSTQSSNVNMSEVKILVQQLVFEQLDALKLLEKKQNSNDWISQEKKMDAEFSALRSEIKFFADMFESSKLEGKGKSEKADDLKLFSQAYNEHLNKLSKRLQYIEQNQLVLDALLNNLKNCCHNESKLPSLIDHQMSVMFESLTSEQVNPNLRLFKDWLFLHFVGTEKYESELKTASEQTRKNEEVKKVAVMEALKQHMEAYPANFANAFSNDDVLTKNHATKIEMMIKKAIMMYDADKTGQTDYALESGGGSVVSTRCSETYSDRNPRITILGFPLWYGSNSPRNAIQPYIHPGQCWAFKGTQGYLVIQLATIIRPTGFVVEHIPKSISPSGNIDSAPKDFSVYGLESEKQSEGKLLGKYFYDNDGDPLQYFPVQAENTTPYNYIELKIHSNHGDLNYTCLYRFRVHGFRN